MNEKYLKSFLKWKTVKQVLGENSTLSLKQKERLDLLFNEFGSPKQLQDSLRTIAFMVKNDLPNIVGRVRRLKKLPASPSLYSFILRYGKKEGLDRYRQAGQSRTPHFKNTKRYWINLGYSKEEAVLKVREIQKTRNENAIRLMKGSSEFTCRSPIFWIKKGFSEQEAKEKVRGIQVTNGLNYYINKFGFEEGSKKYNERINRWVESLNSKSIEEKKKINLKKSHSVEGYIARGFSKEEAKIKAYEYWNGRNAYSNISQKCFDMVLDRLGENDLYFKTKNYEKQFYGKCVDFYDKKSQIVIEFLGDFYHRNPMVYKPSFYSFGKYSFEVWQEDKKRIDLIETHSKVQKVFILWESEFRLNPGECVKSIVDLLYEERNKCGKNKK